MFPNLLLPAFAESRSRLLGAGLAVGAVLAGCNPFAPGLEEISTAPEQQPGSSVTVHGFFTTFRTAYQFRDSTLYGQLLDRRFRFTYHDSATNLAHSWNRDVEMATTNKLFRATRAGTLQWTQYLPTTDTLFSDTLVYVDRAFQLSLQQRNNQLLQGAGSARLELVRKQKGAPWRMRCWQDQSAF